MENLLENSRRKFIGKLAIGTAAGITAFINPFSAGAMTPVATADDADKWFEKAKGRHRIVYDATEPHDGLPFIWPWVFYQTNNQTNTPDSDMTAMVVLRHNAIPFAMDDKLWAKYKLGEVFRVNDNNTKKPAVRNPYYEPKEGDYPFPGIDGIKRLQERGAMFCVCNMALLVYSGVVAKGAGLNAEEVYKDWVSGVKDGIQIVPSGVWAVGRAQEHKFAYCYAGG